MKLWSQLARLGAAVAAFGPPILTEAEDEPEQVAIPTLDTSNQPVAAASIEAPALDADRDLVEDMAPAPTPFVAALPVPVQPPAFAEERAAGLPRTGPKGIAKAAGVTPQPRPWHGGGQRYGG